MHEIKKVAKTKRYEGLKGKLIHLKPKTFDILTTFAKLKNINLKKYLELLCEMQAFQESKKYLDEYEKRKKSNRK